MKTESKLVIRKPNEGEQRRKATCLEQLAQDRHRLLMRWPFVGSLLMRLELVPVRDDRLATASTDGDSIFVDIDFFSKLNSEERLFVLAHEVWHTALLHFARRKDRDILRFNVAADLEIHFTLMSEKMKEPFVLPHDPKWLGLSAEEIYERLPENLADMDKLPKKAKTSASFGKANGSFDKHIYSDNNKSQSGASGGNSQKPSEGSGELVLDDDYTPSVTADSVERSRARTIGAAHQMAKMQGHLPLGIEALLKQLEKPSLPWQEMLKQFVTTCYGGKRRWLPPARRHVWQDIYLPSMRDEKLKAVVALDTSGSTQGDLGLFFAELMSLMKSFGQFELDVIQCDAKVQHVEHFNETTPVPSNKEWKTYGCGGTDFRPVFEYVKTNMKERPDLLLFFTDGGGTAPEKQPGYPVMWVLTQNGSNPSGWGRETHFKRKEEV